MSNLHNSLDVVIEKRHSSSLDTNQSRKQTNDGEKGYILQ